MDTVVFEKMRKNILGHWGKGDFSTPDGFCLLGHIAYALGEQDGDYINVSGEAMPYAQFLSDIILEQYPEMNKTWDVTQGLPLAPWNDAPERTIDEVLMVVEKAIAKANEDAS